MDKILVIIPTYNEEKTIIQLIDELFSLQLNLDILVVDDGKDKTGELVSEKQKEKQNLFLNKREKKAGRGSAVIEGIRFGLKKDYDYIVEMDADFSHQPKELPELMKLASPNGVVIASRYLKGSVIKNWPLQRKVFSRFANIYANFILRIGLHDYTNGYRIYGREALKKIDLNNIQASGYIVLSEIAYMLHLAGATFKERETLFINRVHGDSNFSLHEIKEAFASVIRIKKNTK